VVGTATNLTTERAAEKKAPTAIPERTNR